MGRSATACVSKLPQKEELYVRRLYVVVDKNPSPVAAVLDLTREVGQADFETRLRVWHPVEDRHDEYYSLPHQGLRDPDGLLVFALSAGDILVAAPEGPP